MGVAWEVKPLAVLFVERHLRRRVVESRAGNDMFLHVEFIHHFRKIRRPAERAVGKPFAMIALLRQSALAELLHLMHERVFGRKAQDKVVERGGGVPARRKHDGLMEFKRFEANQIHIRPPTAPVIQKCVAKVVRQVAGSLPCAVEQFAGFQDFVSVFDDHAFRDAFYFVVGIKVELVAMVEKGLGAQLFQIGKGVANPEGLNCG